MDLSFIAFEHIDQKCPPNLYQVVQIETSQARKIQLRSVNSALIVNYATGLAADKCSKEFPEDELSIFCGEPCICPEVPKAAEVAQEKPTPADSVPVATETGKAPGFEILATILGLTGMACIARRR